MLDSHLAQFQTVQDGFKGHGTIRTTITVQGMKFAAIVEWGDGYKNIQIANKASNAAHVFAAQEEMAAGNVDELNMTLHYGYSKNRFQTGLLRCAYLAVFNRFGYEYASHEIVQAIRRRICDSSLQHPRLESLIGVLRNFELPSMNSYIIAPGNVNGVEFFLVIIQLRIETSSYHFVYMPVPVDRCDEFYVTMERLSKENDRKDFEIKIPRELIFA